MDLGSSGAIPSQSGAPNPREEVSFEFKPAFPFLCNSPGSKFLPYAELDLPFGAPGTHELPSPHRPSEIWKPLRVHPKSPLPGKTVVMPSACSRIPCFPALTAQSVKVPLRGARALGASELAQTGGPPSPSLAIPHYDNHRKNMILSRSGYMICGPSAK